MSPIDVRLMVGWPTTLPEWRTVTSVCGGDRASQDTVTPWWTGWLTQEDNRKTTEHPSSDTFVSPTDIRLGLSGCVYNQHQPHLRQISVPLLLRGQSLGGRQPITLPLKVITDKNITDSAGPFAQISNWLLHKPTILTTKVCDCTELSIVINIMNNWFST